jgi:integrase
MRRLLAARNRPSAPIRPTVYLSCLWSVGGLCPENHNRRPAVLRKEHVMPKPFKPTRPFPLPPDAEIVERDGRRCYKTKDKGRTVFYPLSKDGRQYLKPAKCYYFDIKDENGIVRRVKGSTDKAVTEQMIADWQRRIERRKLGYADPAEEHATRPLADHLADYAAYLEAKGDTSAHVTLTVSRIRAVFDGCRFVFPRDLDANTVSIWLTTLRRDGTPVALPDQAEFMPAEVADLLGITGAALRATVKRLNLPATGNGKARRFPRATVEALAQTQAKGVSPETVNHYVRALRGFGRWLVKSKRIGSNPLETLSLLNVAVDVRRRRRELTVEELRRLLEVTRASGRTFRGWTGPDRYCLYLTAVSTGLRAGALANLTPGDFDLTPPSPVVTVPARFSKNRRTHTVPLPFDVAAELRSYLAPKAAGSPIWGGTWAKDHRGAEMLRRDLIAADVPYAVEGPDGPEYADFHSLRHTYLTMLGRHGVDLRTAQELAGHSTPLLTARYSHRRLYDLAGAVDKLPNLVPTSTPNADAAEVRRTGTDDAPAAVLPLRPLAHKGSTGGRSDAVPDAVPDAVTYCIREHQSALPCNHETVQSTPQVNSQPLETQQPGTFPRQVAAIFTSEGDGTRTRNHRIDSPVL